MTIRITSCYEVVCDNAGQAHCDGGWDEGAPHFLTKDEAVGYARQAGFVVTGLDVLCGRCAARRDCDRLGHQWGDWEDVTHMAVPFRRRSCRHCDTDERDANFNEIVLLNQVRHILDNAAADGG